MAIGDTYATLSELKSYASITSNANDTELGDALTAASIGIEQACHRQFNTDVGVSTRLIPADQVLSDSIAYTDDFHTTTGLVVETDDNNDGAFETIWSAVDYQLEPLSGVMAGRTGWPYNRIRAVGTPTFPCSTTGRATLRVTARWGWATVPAPVKQACLIVSQELYKLKDAPFGVAGISGDLGVLRVRENPMAMKLLAPYVLDPVLVGMGM